MDFLDDPAHVPSADDNPTVLAAWIVKHLDWDAAEALTRALEDCGLGYAADDEDDDDE